MNLQFCYRENQLLQLLQQNEKPTSAFIFILLYLMFGLFFCIGFFFVPFVFLFLHYSDTLTWCGQFATIAAILPVLAGNCLGWCVTSQYLIHWKFLFVPVFLAMYWHDILFCLSCQILCCLLGCLSCTFWLQSNLLIITLAQLWIQWHSLLQLIF